MNTLGTEAESKAADYLTALGYELLERNYRRKFGEIDIIARNGDTVVFVEVRLRRNESYGGAAETVGRLKQRRIAKAAAAYAQARDYDGPMRFDVIALNSERLEHIPAAFGGL